MHEYTPFYALERYHAFSPLMPFIRLFRYAAFFTPLPSLAPPRHAIITCLDIFTPWPSLSSFSRLYMPRYAAPPFRLDFAYYHDFRCFIAAMMPLC